MIVLAYMDTINALTFRKKFGEILDKVVKSGQPIIVERQNKPTAVLYPYDMKKEEIEEKKRADRMEKASKMLEAWRNTWGSNKNGFGGLSSTEFIRKMRDERYGKKWLKTRTHYWNDKS